MKLTYIPQPTIKFLKDIKNNNNKPWFTDNKARYQEALDTIKTFGDHLMDEMNKIDEIEAIKIFRIYRDTRFSKNKTPYKHHLAGSLKRATKRLRGGYYFHIEPGNTMIAGGFWAPNPPDLKRIRQEIELDDKPLRKIINAARFKNNFGQLDGDKVKTAPKGFSKDHPAIDLIRHKQFIVHRKFTDKEVTDPTFLKEVVKTFKAMRPFFDYMSEVLTTDLNGVSIIDD